MLVIHMIAALPIQKAVFDKGKLARQDVVVQRGLDPADSHGLERIDIRQKSESQRPLLQDNGRGMEATIADHVMRQRTEVRRVDEIQRLDRLIGLAVRGRREDELRTDSRSTCSRCGFVPRPE